MREKILITGSSGYLGKQVSNFLKDDYEIIGIDLVEGEFTKYKGSLTDKHFIKEILNGITTVIHTASLHAPHVLTHTKREFINTNITGTLNLLEASNENSVKKFIYTSTTSLYGESMNDSKQAVWVTEEIPTIPRDIYDITKIAAEGLCRDFFNEKGLQTTVLRVSRFWDEPMRDKIFYRMYRGLDVRDAVTAHKLAMEKHFSKFDVFNISAQSIFTKDDLIGLKNNVTPILQSLIPEFVKYFKQMNWEIQNSIDRVYVIDKAKKILGYSPKYNIKEILEEVSLIHHC